MKLDHIAYRVKNRHEAAQFFRLMFNYEIGTEFDIEFDDGSKADCHVLVPPMSPVIMVREGPEIFISDGSPGSIVGDWVEARNGVGFLSPMVVPARLWETGLKREMELAVYTTWRTGQIR